MAEPEIVTVADCIDAATLKAAEALANKFVDATNEANDKSLVVALAHGMAMEMLWRGMEPRPQKVEAHALVALGMELVTPEDETETKEAAE